MFNNKYVCSLLRFQTLEAFIPGNFFSWTILFLEGFITFRHLETKKTTKIPHWKNLHSLSERLASLGMMGDQLRTPLKPSLR